MTHTADLASHRPPTGEPEHARPVAVAVTTNTLPVLLDPHRQRAESNGWDYVDLDSTAYEIPQTVLDLMEGRVARQHNVIPFGVKDRAIVIATENPNDPDLRALLGPLFDGRTIRFAYADPSAIHRRIEEVYSARAEASRLAEQRQQVTNGDASNGGDLGRIESIAEGDNEQMLRLLIEQALRDGASDIHIEPTEDDVEVRFRIDGALALDRRIQSRRGAHLVNLIKTQARMHTDETRLPESGGLVFERPNAKSVDIRVQTYPTAWGQSVAMRLATNIWRPLTSLGFSERNLTRYRSAITQPNGIILATGPMGEGKSTLLFASIMELIDETKKIVTIEDPVEFKAPRGISQMAINDAVGFDYEAGRRAILRTDADIILIGEIRDRATADTAVDASMYGRRVFSSLHTNDAPSAIVRLSRLGIESHLVADTLRSVVAQRLVRRLCVHCKIEQPADRDTYATWGFDVDRLPALLAAPNPNGCKECHLGWSGRVPIHEVMLMSADMVDAVTDGAPKSTLHRLAIEAGMTSMREDGFEKALDGITTIDAVNAVTLRSLA